MKRIILLILAAGVLLAAMSGATMKGKQLPGKTWVGVAADTTGATGMVAGDILNDYATGKFYIYTGLTGWALMKSFNSADSLLAKYIRRTLQDSITAKLTSDSLITKYLRLTLRDSLTAKLTADSLIVKYIKRTLQDSITAKLTSDSLLVKYIRRTNKDTTTVQIDKTPYRIVSALDTLTTTGNFLPVCVTGYTNAMFVFGMSGVTTSATVQYRGTVAGLSPLGWGTIDAENDTTVYVGTSGTFYRMFASISGLDSVRQKVVSEAGGTGGSFWQAIIMWNPFK